MTELPDQSCTTPDDPPIEVLQPDAQSLLLLQRAGLTTIGRAEAALGQDPGLGHVLGFGSKRTAWLKQAINTYRGANTTGTTPSATNGVVPDDTSHRASKEKKPGQSEGPQHKWLWALGGLLVGCVAYLIAAQGLPLPFVLVLFFITSVGAAILVFHMFPDTNASADGSFDGDSPLGKLKFAFRLGGAAATGLVYFVALSAALLVFGNQTVTVYLNFTDEDGMTSATAHGPVEVTYRRSRIGQGVARGSDNAAVIRDLPSWTSELRVNNVSVPGYIVMIWAVNTLGA